MAITTMYERLAPSPPAFVEDQRRHAARVFSRIHVGQDHLRSGDIFETVSTSGCKTRSFSPACSHPIARKGGLRVRYGTPSTHLDQNNEPCLGALENPPPSELWSDTVSRRMVWCSGDGLAPNFDASSSLFRKYTFPLTVAILGMLSSSTPHPERSSRPCQGAPSLRRYKTSSAGR